jgi:Arc/MetJ-type ribon-helix-helix transcriptional regulator
MNVQILQEQQAIVEALVAAGRFASVDEAISEVMADAGRSDENQPQKAS